ncbi:MAG TPA: 6,7-dimethyl-8-ribityllumazine synthase [Xanthobacteraceae bacterium]|jgi:6,7-dimethyl-8-ribityllumazine synthase|nr:6,7-dimethyl-8-ribityllumazine synthase [Xanthobacteraceae bacterium]
MAKPRRASNEKEGADVSVRGARILVVESRFYDDISTFLLAGARRVLEQAGAEFDIVTVPGALEIPQAIALALDAARARRRPYEGVVALGCVIRGETSHYDIVAGESARALMDLALTRRVGIGNGILTVDTDAQATARARPEEGDKGGAAAAAALALVKLARSLAPRRGRR